MRRWRRVDPWGARQVVTGFMVLVGSTMTVFVAVTVGRGLAEGRVDANAALGVAVALPFMGLWLTFALRLYLAGIYVNDRGVRLRHIFRTRTFSWSEVTGFEARPALILGEPTVRDACWVRTTGGAFESAVQRHSSRAGWRKNIGPVLSADDFARMLARLDAERAAHRHGQLGGGAVVSR
ncbi:PH domain-containing protein [Micromonospora sp. NPDC005237]|uniref:PH domain-containing protein n=1 Tax=Micromonospora sp. NPDC005237 TaxID=3155113 RepID=UPI0033B57787